MNMRGRNTVDTAVSSEKIDLLTDLAERFNDSEAARVDGECVYVEVRSICQTCPPIGQPLPPGGVPSTTEFRLVLMLGDGTSLHPCHRAAGL